MVDRLQSRRQVVAVAAVIGTLLLSGCAGQRANARWSESTDFVGSTDGPKTPTATAAAESPSLVGTVPTTCGDVLTAEATSDFDAAGYALHASLAGGPDPTWP
jgi:hypothetical protein